MVLYQVSVGGRNYRIQMEPTARVSSGHTHDQSSTTQAGEVHWNVLVDGHEISVSCVSSAPDALSIIVNGESFDVRREPAGEGRIFVRGRVYECAVQDPRSLRSRKPAGLADTGEQKLAASMPGKVIRLLALEGEKIKADQGILVIEAMKMQNEVRSPKDGVLKKLLVLEGTNVVAGEVLAIIE
jgi:biotin carboxyl carrier protein